MLFGILSGILWALDTTILSIALSLAPFSDNTAQTIAFAAITSSALHDVLCAFSRYKTLLLRTRKTNWSPR